MTATVTALARPHRSTSTTTTTTTPGGPALPRPRGPMTRALVAALRGEPGTSGESLSRLALADDPLFGEDAPLALYVLYELSYRGFEGVDDAWEWDPDALGLRGRLERALLARLRSVVAARFGDDRIAPDAVRGQLLCSPTVKGLRCRRTSGRAARSSSSASSRSIVRRIS